jgi:hypothetical protein
MNDDVKEKAAEKIPEPAKVIKKRAPLFKKDKMFTYALGKGNFPSHIGNALLARGNWKEVPDDNAIESAHLFWKQVNLSFLNYDRFDNRMSNSNNPPLLFNHMEINRGICTKTGLVRSLKAYYDNN